MSELNAWLLAGGLLGVTLYFANAIVYRRRFGTWLRVEARRNLSSGSVSASQWAGAAIIVAAGLVCFAAPFLVPQSRFALWLNEPFSLVVCVVWWFLFSAIVGSVSAVASLLVKRRRAERRLHNSNVA